MRLDTLYVIQAWHLFGAISLVIVCALGLRQIVAAHWEYVMLRRHVLRRDPRRHRRSIA